MITVLWEDQRGQVASFGPGELLTACLADTFDVNFYAIKPHVRSVPKKGNNQVLRCLEESDTLHLLLHSGAVIAVFDRDRATELLARGRTVPYCITWFREELQRRAPGDYKVVLLERNVETLVIEAQRLLKIVPSGGKPTPDERDRILGKLAHGSDMGVRQQLLVSVPSFERLVHLVRDSIRSNRLVGPG